MTTFMAPEKGPAPCRVTGGCDAAGEPPASIGAASRLIAVRAATNGARRWFLNERLLRLVCVHAGCAPRGVRCSTW